MCSLFIYLFVCLFAFFIFFLSSRPKMICDFCYFAQNSFVDCVGGAAAAFTASAAASREII